MDWIVFILKSIALIFFVIALGALFIIGSLMLDSNV
jgi:hypothetical protein